MAASATILAGLDELKAVIAGNGPCNAQRLARRRAAHDEGAWVREAALAHAAKHADQWNAPTRPIRQRRPGPAAR